jgi:ferritin
MISEQMTIALNKQAAEEAYASSVYLSMALWCDAQGYEGAARVPAVAEPPHEFNSLPDIMKQVLELEMSVASKIHTIVDLAIAEKDHATWNWLQDFVAEQREAEIKARNILDRIEVIGTQATGLYEIDKMLGKMAEEEEEDED